MTALFTAVLFASVVPAWAHPTETAAEYRWVEPSSGGSTTAPAQGREAMVPRELLVSGRADVWTPDLQAVLTVEADLAGLDAAQIALTPLAASSLPPLPDSLEPNGNAYRVEVVAPDWQLDELRLRLTTPFQASSVWSLQDAGWVETPMTVSAGDVTTPIAPRGIYLVATRTTDGHATWWAAFSHDPIRPWLVVGAAAFLLQRELRRRRHKISPETMSRTL